MLMAEHVKAVMAAIRILPADGGKMKLGAETRGREEKKINGHWGKRPFLRD